MFREQVQPQTSRDFFSLADVPFTQNYLLYLSIAKSTMKILTTTFLTCAVKSCRSSPASYPLHFRDATLLRTEIEYNPLLLRNLLPRLNLDALEVGVSELGLGSMLPSRQSLEQIAEGASAGKDEEKGEETGEGTGEAEGEKASMELDEGKEGDEEEILKKLHALLIETSVQEGKLVCGNCGFEYPIKEGVGNFLLPGHLV